MVFKPFLKWLFSAVLFFSISSIPAQSSGWVLHFGSPETDWLVDLKTDAAGNIYQTGYLEDTCDLDPGPNQLLLPGALTEMVYLQKLNAQQDLEWAFSLEGTGIGTSSTTVRNLDVDPLGNVVIAGDFFGSIDFEPGSGTTILQSDGSVFTNHRDIYVAKYSSSGALLWAHSIGSSSYDAAGDVAFDGQGNVLFTGVFRDTIDLDPGFGTVLVPAHVIDANAFLVQLDPGGNFLWEKHFDYGADEAGALTTFSNGDIVITNHFSEPVDLDPDQNPGVHVVDGDGSILTRYTNFGTHIWSAAVRKATNGGGGAITGLFPGSQQELVVATGYSDSLKLISPDTTILLTSDANRNGVVGQLNATGQWESAWQLECSDLLDPMEVLKDSDGNTFTCGMFRDLVDFDPGPDSTQIWSLSYTSLFVHKVDSNGNYLWTKTIEGPGINVALSMDLLGDTALLIGGFFSDSVHFDIGTSIEVLTAAGRDDIFLWNIDIRDGAPTGKPEISFENELVVFPNPTSRSLTIQLNGESIQEVVVFNTLGVLVLQKLLTGVEQAELELPSQPGIYLVGVRDLSGKSHYKTVLKQ